MNIHFLNLQEKLEELTLLAIDHFLINLLSLKVALVLPEFLPGESLLAGMALYQYLRTLVQVVVTKLIVTHHSIWVQLPQPYLF